MRRPLVGVGGVSYAVAANPGAIVWQGGTSHLSGLFLPSLQAFTIALPSAFARPPGSPVDPVGALGLTSGARYVEDLGTGTIWRAASPTDLR
jgi:hypothetical protein